MALDFVKGVPSSLVGTVISLILELDINIFMGRCMSNKYVGVWLCGCAGVQCIVLGVQYEC